MNIDFDLGKNRKNEDIIVRIRESLDKTWYEFKEQDKILDLHTRLALLPPSKRNYKFKREIRGKFVKEDVLKFYYDSCNKKFKFSDYYLPEYKTNAGHTESAKKVENEDETDDLKKLEKLKFDTKHHNVFYFLYKFKSLTRNMQISSKKYYLKKIFPCEDLNLTTDFDNLPIHEIYNKISSMYYGNQDSIVQNLLNLNLENSSSLENFIDESFKLIDLVFFDLTERQKIRFIIDKLPDSLGNVFSTSFIDRNVLNYRRKFKNFLLNYSMI